MRPVEPVRVAGAVVDVAVPSGSGHLAGVSTAGFRGRAEDPVELQMVNIARTLADDSTAILLVEHDIDWVLRLCDTISRAIWSGR